MTKNGLIVGSFDPLTIGHEHLIKVGAKLVDKLYILISKNADKVSLLNDYFKEKMILKFIKTNNLQNVEFIGFNNKEFSLNYVKQYNISILIRGIRDSNDFIYEENLRYFNYDVDKSIQTIYVPSHRNQEKISSSAVRSLMQYNDWDSLVDKYVSSDVLSILRNIDKYNLLSKYWKKIIDLDKVEEKWFNYVFDKYSEAHRVYHSVNHLIDLLKKVNHLKFYSMTNKINKYEFEESLSVFILFCFFHDIEYEIGSNKNEEKSVKIFEEYAKETSVSVPIKNKVIEAILLTKNHALKSDQWVVNFCLDCDLSILVSEEEKFIKYCHQIRQEYISVPDDVFIPKRIEFLEKIKLTYPFHTERFKDENLKARYFANINNAILALSDKKY